MRRSLNSNDSTSIFGLIWGWVDDFWSLVFPKNCVSCRSELLEGEVQLCNSCIVLLPYTHFERMQGNPSAERMTSFLDVGAVASILYYSNKQSSKRVLNSLKYQGNAELGRLMGNLMGQRILGTEYAEVDALVPVPLTPEKEEKRGYNQARLLCEGMSEILGIPVSVSLRRVRARSSQTTLSRYERWMNTKGDFGLSCTGDLANMRVLLVDDVLTTGATLSACYEVLKSSVKEVKILTLALA